LLTEILGAKLYFYYMPLLLIGYYVINSEADLRKFFYINLSLMVVIVALGNRSNPLPDRVSLNPAVMADDIRLLSETTAPLLSLELLCTVRPQCLLAPALCRLADCRVDACFGFSGYLLLGTAGAHILPS